ncbi:hypothetical protein [Profundibacterium mesophilum]|uniref:Uncharacterized protein n=1 Tax=Profundibacterium mesophilum KAUST100406-0324 TaxID=1037889 RepID=A0A921TBP1_9RHOB|nr:hypothetical protein [Profundibacterium mesophilum]KAF0675975.1 hypothetical protein PMES_01730 [Profundibacterium mesophilum KAUST100406-0324]
MDMETHVAQGEHGVIRVFSLDMPIAQARSLVDGRGNGAPGLPALLGISGIDKSRLELIDPADLSGVGLSNYLIDGLGADAEEVAADSARLSGLTGTVLVVPSSAFSGRERELAPREPLLPVASYRESGTVPPAAQAPVAGARGTAEGVPQGEAVPPRRRGGRTWMWVAVTAILLLGLWLLIGTAG